MDMTPNQRSVPAQPWNDPMVAPFLGAMHAAPVDFSEIPEDAAMVGEGVLLTPQGPTNDLMSMRAKFPFLPIVPFPAITKPLFLTANQARNVPVPSGAVLLCIDGNLTFYVSRNGLAEVPTAANTADNLGDNVCQSFIPPKGVFWYVGGMNQFSIIAPADTIVSLAWYVPDQYPRL